MVFLIMKRIYLFGRLLRVFFLISCSFLVFGMVEILRSDFRFFNLFLLAVSVCFVIVWLIWTYSLGVFVDKKRNTLTVVTGLSSKEKRQRVLSNVSSVDVELNGNLGMTFIINYKHNCNEKIEYKFFRISFVEKSQYRRIKTQLSNLKLN